MVKKFKRDKNLPVVLLEDIQGIGNCGEVKKLKRGFVAFLLRHKKALVINKNNIKKLENFKLLSEKNKKERIEKLNLLKEKIENLVFEASIRIGPNKEVYNSININNIVNFLKQNDIKVNKNQIILDKPIKSTGEFSIPINLGYEIKTYLKVVIKEERVNF